MLWLGLAGVALLFLGLTGLVSIVQPPFVSTDEVHHFDYAWRVGHGELPRFEDGVTVPHEGRDDSVQLVAHHPPLFYAVLAPAVTPLVDQGRWRAGVVAGRGIVALIGLAAVLAVAWGTTQVMDDPEPALIVAAAAFTAVLGSLVNHSAAIYNDALAILTATVTLGLVAMIIRHGATPWRLLALTAACAAGLATRVSFLAVFVVAVATVGVVMLTRPASESRRRRLAATGVVTLVLVAVPVLASGWFYVRNARITGNLLGSQSDVLVERLHREQRGVLEVVADLHLWQVVARGLFSTPASPTVDPSSLERWLPILLVVALGALLVVATARRLRSGEVSRADRLVCLMLAVATAGVFLQSAVYVAGGGGANPRYLLPAVLPVAVAAGAALLGRGRARGAGVVVFAAAAAALTVEQSYRVLRDRVFDSDVGVWEAWRGGAGRTGVPAGLVPAALSAMVAGVAIIGVALWRLTERAAAADPLDRAWPNS
jgi:hypothetical protein